MTNAVLPPIQVEGIRPATLADAPGCAAVYRPHVETGTASFETEAPDSAAMAGRIDRCLANGWPWLVLERNGAIIGYAYASQFRDRAAYRHTAETSVYLAPGQAGQGFGRQLMAALVPACSAVGFRQLVAVIGDSRNAASIGLHHALGFRHVGTLTAVGFKHGKWLDVVYMQRSTDELSQCRLNSA
jgi:phosphinothricin acetyltransferase